MRVATLLSAALLLVSPALAAPVAQGGVSASLIASEQPPPPKPAAQPCTNSKERRSWLPLWRRQTIVAAHDCSWTLAQGTTARFGSANAPHGV